MSEEPKPIFSKEAIERFKIHTDPTNFKVYTDPSYPNGSLLMGYKGTSTLEIGPNSIAAAPCRPEGFPGFNILVQQELFE